MRSQIKISAISDPHQLFPLPLFFRPLRKITVHDIDGALRVVGQLVLRHLMKRQIFGVDTKPFEPLEIKCYPLINELEMFGIRFDEVFHLHLLKLARAQNKISGRDLVAKRFSNLRDSERNLPAHRGLDIKKVNKDSLRGFRTQIRKRRRIVFVSSSAQRGPEHHVEITFVGEVCRTALRTLDEAASKSSVGVEGRATTLGSLREIPFEFVGAHSALALATIDERIVKRRLVSRVLPNQP